jgi:hypothetical protein|tara:strand:- start:360 stop:1214 length:855 start_codon:yes stop_codon:yes gene_type:complete
MHNQIVFVADFFADQVKGGGELNDWELISLLKNMKYEIELWNSNQVRVATIKQRISSGCKFIVSNFASLPSECMKTIASDGDYVIYEHDHKYLASRNPMDYPDLVAPQDKIINREFYERAKAVFCQSYFHMNIINKNLQINNLVNLSGNLWSVPHLDILEEMASIEKKDCHAVLNYSIPHKNTAEAIRYCEYKGLKFDLIEPCAPEKFLRNLGKSSTLVFFPKSPETLSRIVVESRMMGMAVKTTKNIGAIHEEWFSKKGVDLVNIMRNKRVKIPELVMEKLGE